jgi:hypothetical protein
MPGWRKHSERFARNCVQGGLERFHWRSGFCGGARSKWFVLIDAKAKPEAKKEITIATQSHSRRLFDLKEEEAIINDVEKLK